jgi:hypothetical protein
MVFPFGVNWSVIGVLRFVVIRRLLCYLTFHKKWLVRSKRVRLEARKTAQRLLVLQHSLITNFV